MGAAAQTVQFNQTVPQTPATIAPPASGPITAPSLAPSSQLTAPFDPYAGSSGSALTAPRFGTPNFGNPTTPLPANATPWPSTSIAPAPSGAVTPWSPPPVGATPSTLFPNSGGTSPYAVPPPAAYGGTYPTYPQTSPGVLFPNGVFGPNSQLGPYVEPFRILQHPRFSDTWISGGDHDRDVQIHDFEFAVTGAIPHFLASTQPLYITPTFLLHLWDGPQGIAGDLPPNAYSAFVDAFWASDPNRPIGAEIGVAVGAFTDFETFNKHSVRVIGEGFGVLRLTPTLTFKLGVWYLNRNDLKLLPAGGLVWQPNPQTKFDILFPNPKYTQYLTTIGNSDVWWYVAGEYGGGAWTIERADGTSDRIDINDIRVKVGIDWINQRNWRGFVEAGYVFNRRVVYVVDPTDNFKARDAFLLGAGFSF
jgi:hypothetical protein